MSRRRIFLTDEALAIAERCGSLGLTLAMTAKLLGLDAATLRRMKRREARVLRALESGRAKAQLAVGKALYDRAVRGDVPAIVWWERTRANRSERQVLEHAMQDNSGGVRERLAARLDRLAGGN